MGCTNSTPTASDEWIGAMIAWRVTVGLTKQAVTYVDFTDKQYKKCEEALHIIDNKVGIAINVLGDVGKRGDDATFDTALAAYNEVIDAHGKAVVNYEFAKKAHAMALENHQTCFSEETKAASFVKECE